MAFLSLSLSLSLLSSARTPTTPSVFCPSPPSTSSAAATTTSSASMFPALLGFPVTNSPRVARGGRRSVVVGMAPEEEKMTRRSPLDFPIWDRPKQGRRPNIFPQFSPMKTPLPPPMPADPPEEDEEEEEEKKEEEEEDPDKEETDEPEQ